MFLVRKLFFAFLLTLAISASFGAIGHADTEHPPHNMLLFGTEEIFASHIVYKEPHNYQVTLKINLTESAKEHYLFLRDSSPPDAQVVLLLDPMDISKIAEVESISGTIMVRKSSNRILSARVSLKREDFEVIYFNKLPLSLSKESHLHSGSDNMIEKTCRSGQYLCRGECISVWQACVETSKIGFITAGILQCAKDDQRPQCCRPINNCDY